MTTPSLLGPCASDLVLQICGGEHDGRVLKVAANKCLIGSAVGCTLRLRARGIRPVHALILRGPSGAVVRSWTADVQLNGKGCTESALVAGDVLQVGPVRLTVTRLGVNDSADSSPDEASPTGMATMLLPAIPPESLDESLVQQFNATIAQLREELDAAAKRRALDQDAFSRQRANWEQQAEQRAAVELHRERLQWQAEAEQRLTDATNEWQTRHAADRAQLEARAAELSAELESLRTSHAEELGSVAREMAILKQSLASKEGQEEFARHSVTSQVEQLTHAFELVRQERDELFQRLLDDQQLFDQHKARVQHDVLEARQLADQQVAAAHEEANRRLEQLQNEAATLRGQLAEYTNSQQQSRDSWTQARIRLEADVAGLTSRLRESEELLHAARTQSGEHQASVLAEIERMRGERDAVREQLVRQQQDWTEFRERLEAAGNEDRAVAQARLEAAQAELQACQQERDRLAQDHAYVQKQLAKLEIELEETLAAKSVEQQNVQNRFQQMTISMEQLQLDRGGVQQQFEQQRTEWDVERDELAKCVAELQHDVTRLQTELDRVQQQQTEAQQAERTEAENLQQQAAKRIQQLEATIAELQGELTAAQQAIAVTCAPPARAEYVAEEETFGRTINVSNQELAAFQEQWQNQRQDSYGDIPLGSSSEVGSTINVSNQDLAALQEQLAASVPNNLLEPRPCTSQIDSADLDHREAALRMQAEELAAQQAQLEEDQAMVARQRIELEQLQSSLVEMEESLRRQAEAQRAEANQSDARPTMSAADYTGYESQEVDLLLSEECYLSEVEHESPSLSESEAFAAMADQVAALYREAPPESSLVVSESIADEPILDEPVVHELVANEQLANEELAVNDAVENECIADEALVVPAGEMSSEALLAPVELAHESLVIPAEDNLAAEPVMGVVSEPEPQAEPELNLVIASPDLERDLEPVLHDASPLAFDPTEDRPSEAFDSDCDIDAHMARVMKQEPAGWNERPSETPAILDPTAPVDEAPTTSQAVNSVLDRLREAGLWKGEGTAKSDQLPSSGPPVEEGLCRLSQGSSLLADLHDSAEVEEPVDEIVTAAPSDAESHGEELAEPEQPDLALLSRPSSGSLAQAASSEEGESEDSIESYMSRLMQRLRKTDGTEVPAEKSHGSRQASGHLVSRPVPAAAPAPAPKPVVQEAVPLTSLSDLAPRSQAPELGANLAAMRELANSAARGAIETHQKKSSVKRVTYRTGSSLLGLLIAAAFTYYWVRTGSLYALSGVGVSMLWAISSSLLAGLQGMALKRPTELPEVADRLDNTP
jgi:hypothetical protein